MSVSENTSNAVNQSQEPLTVVVSRRVRKGEEREFEQLSSQMTKRAANFPG